jgi:hypothetical protein
MYHLEVCEGVPYNAKIDLKFRKPPLIFNILYDDYKHRGMSFFGSFKHKEPND